MIVTDFIEKDNARTIVGTLRPSGRFSVCQTFPSKCRNFNVKKEIQKTPGQLHSVQELDESYRRLSGVGGEAVSELQNPHQVVTPCVGSSIAINSDIRAKRGSKGIGARQRDVLCWAANTLERAYGRKCMSFLTYTLPELSDADLKSVQDNWARIVDTVVIYIKRDLKDANIDSFIVGCSELQVERYEASGRAYPHLHMVFRGRRDYRSHWAIEPERFRDIWRRCVSRFLSDTAYLWDASENVEQVRTSSGGYLAKYISKCGSKHGMAGRDLWHPTDWIVCSRALRRWYSVLTRKGYEVGLVLLDVVHGWRVGMGYKQPIIISTPAYGDRVIGQWGWLQGEFICPDYNQLHPCA